VRSVRYLFYARVPLPWEGIHSRERTEQGKVHSACAIRLLVGGMPCCAGQDGGDIEACLGMHDGGQIASGARAARRAAMNVTERGKCRT
jgi:hypothetical protein